MKQQILSLIFLSISIALWSQDEVIHEGNNPKMISNILNNTGGFYFEKNNQIKGGLTYNHTDSLMRWSHTLLPHNYLGLTMKTEGDNAGHFGFGMAPGQHFLSMHYDSKRVPNVVNHPDNTAHIALYEDQENDFTRIWLLNTFYDDRWALLARHGDDSKIGFAHNGLSRFMVDSLGKVKINQAYELTNVDGANGQGLVTDGNGTVTWQNIASVFKDSSDIILPKTDMTGKTFLLGFDELPGASNAQGRFMYFDKDQGALRGGLSNASNDFDVNTTGIATFAYGHNVSADGNYSAALGRESHANGAQSIALGYGSTTHGFSSVAIGLDNDARSSVSMVLGRGLVNRVEGSVIVGSYNDSIYTSNQSYNLDAPVFVVGNGANDNLRQNAVLVKANGNVGIGTNEPFGILDVHAKGSTDGISIVGSATTNRAQLKIINEADKGRTYAVQSSGGGAAVGKGKFVIRDIDASANRIVMDSTGKVGIGISNPSQMLELAGAIEIGNTTDNSSGTIRHTGSDFEGYTGGTWKSLTGSSLLSDNDNDTEVTVEKTTDADEIEITIKGDKAFELGKSADGHEFIWFENPDDNISIGNKGLKNAEDNVVVGDAAGLAIDSMYRSVIIGESAASLATKSFDNVYVGDNAAQFNTGNQNVIIGTKAGAHAATSTNASVLIGYKAGNYTPGDSTICIGYGTESIDPDALRNLLIGTSAKSFDGQNWGHSDDNVVVGNNATATGGNGVSIGNFSTNDGGAVAVGHEANAASGVAIGAGALCDGGSVSIGGVAEATSPGAIAIGLGAKASGLNSIALGKNLNVTTSEKVTIGSVTANSIGGYEPWTDLSDGRFKNNVQENIPGLDFIKGLRPVNYKVDYNKVDDHIRNEPVEDEEYKTQLTVKSQKQRSGFIAQEVETLAESLGWDFQGVYKPQNENDHYSLAYSTFVVPLVKAVQEQQEMIEELQTENMQLKDSLLEVQNLKNEIALIKAHLESNNN